MPPKEGRGADPIAKAIMRRARKNLAVMSASMGQSPEASGFMLRRGNFYAGVESGIETATCVTLEKVASGEITQEIAQRILDAANKAPSEGE